jgi:DcaP outer membrane protein
MKLLKSKAAILLTTSAIALALPSMASAQATVKFGGFIKAVGSFSQYSAGEPGSASAIRDFYHGQTIPTGTGSLTDYNHFTSNVKQSRLTASIASDIAGHTVKGYIEGDFQAGLAAGSQTATNAYNPALRRAFLQVDNITVGQDWSTFQNTAVLPESTDYAGTLDGTVFVRQPLVRYTHKLSPNATLMVSAENPETTVSAAAQDDDKMPDIAARLAMKTGFGEFSVAGLVRQLNTVSGSTSADATGAGVSVSGVVPFGEKGANKFTFMVTHGDGIGRYVAAAATTDAVLVAGKLETPTTTNALATVKLAITPTSRVNLMAGYHNADYPSVVTSTGLTKSLQSVAANYFVSPVKGVDFGVEVRHATHERFGGAKGNVDRIEFAARYSF